MIICNYSFLNLFDTPSFGVSQRIYHDVGVNCLIQRFLISLRSIYNDVRVFLFG